MNTWVEVFQSVEPHRAELARSILSENGIDSVIYNKQDSMYCMLNPLIPVKLMVSQSDVVQAKHVIRKLLD
ncbi:MAG: DUF2007 domain-containing protein [Flavobacteriales bacterium]